MGSAVVTNEIKKERRLFQGVKENLDKRIIELETKRGVTLDELRNATLCEKRQNCRLMEMEAKLKYFQDNFIEKQELLKIKHELESKYKLDMNTQLKKVSAGFSKEHDDSVRTMNQSLALREDTDNELSVRPSKTMH